MSFAAVTILTGAFPQFSLYDEEFFAITKAQFASRPLDCLFPADVCKNVCNLRKVFLYICQAFTVICSQINNHLFTKRLSRKPVLLHW